MSVGSGEESRRTHRVKHEEVETSAGAEGDERGAAVERVAGAHDAVPLLQGVLLCGLAF